jgi:hypothetical protein
MKTFWEPLIIENDEVKNLKYLVHRLRQDVVNCACDIIRAQSGGGLKKKDETALFNMLHERCRNLDSVERALSLAETYNYELMEKDQVALLKEEENKEKAELRKEESPEALRVRKQRLQKWIDERSSRCNSEIELLRVILCELGTIRNWLIDPDEYERIQND